MDEYIVDDIYRLNPMFKPIYEGEGELNEFD